MFKVTKDMPSANIQRSIRFTDDLFERLKEVSKNKNISFNKLVLMCCQYALDDMEPEDGE